MTFKIQVSKKDSQPVIRVKGEIIKGTLEKITSKINRLRKLKIDKVIIDLSETTFIDSYGLGAFVYIWRTFEEEGRALVIMNPKAMVKELLEETNLDKCFTVISDESDK